LTSASSEVALYQTVPLPLWTFSAVRKKDEMLEIFGVLNKIMEHVLGSPVL